jgi:DNA-directed RNA polymerase specialized sigma24 family protein
MAAPAGPGDFQRLLAEARAGSLRALGALFADFRSYLLTIADGEIDPALRIKSSGSDLVQEAFLEAQQILDRFTGDRPEEFRAWLRAILLNKAGDFRRRPRGSEGQGGGGRSAL